MKFGMCIAPLIKDEKPKPLGTCKDCKHFGWIQGMGMHPYCWLYSEEIDSHWDHYCDDYKRKWWKFWRRK